MEAAQQLISTKNSTIDRINANAVEPSGYGPLRGVPRFVAGLGAIASRVVPALTARLALRLFLRTRHYGYGLHEKVWLGLAETSYLTTLGLPVCGWNCQRFAVHRWGVPRAGRVYLLHGWSGRATQFHALIPGLLAAGYQVLAVDAPGHGESDGRMSTVLHFANALDRAIRAFGPADVVITHSFGGPGLLKALSDGLSVGAAVLVSPPSDLVAFSRVFGRALGLSNSVRQQMQHRLEQMTATLWEDLDGERLARRQNIPALVIHDEGDREVPFASGAGLAAAWPGARLLPTRGLGHRRILADATTCKAIVDFVERR